MFIGEEFLHMAGCGLLITGINKMNVSCVTCFENEVYKTKKNFSDTLILKTIEILMEIFVYVKFFIVFQIVRHSQINQISERPVCFVLLSTGLHIHDTINLLAATVLYFLIPAFYFFLVNMLTLLWCSSHVF